MALIRLLAAVLTLGRVASAQISTPPACRGTVVDREVFRRPHGRIKFHLKFHDGSATFDARSVVKLRRRGASEASCNDGDVLDVVIDELVKARNQNLPRR